MVKKIIWIVLYTVVFFGAVVYFVPKQNLYYALENELQKYGIVIDAEDVIEHPFSLELRHPKVYLKGIEVFQALDVDIRVWIFFNEIKTDKARIGSVVKNFIPTHIDTLQIVYSLWHPFYITGYSKGNFGSINLQTDILERKGVLRLKPSEMMRTKYANTLRKLEKNQKGEYLYEQNF